MALIIILIFLFLVWFYAGGSSSSSSSSNDSPFGKVTDDKDLQNFLDVQAAEHIINPDQEDNFFNFPK